MIEVRITQQITGTRNGVPWPAPGGTIELPNGEAASMVAAGYAEYADGAPEVEEAVAPEPERRPARKRRSRSRAVTKASFEEG